MNPSAYPHILRRERLLNLASIRAASGEIPLLPIEEVVEKEAAGVEALPPAGASGAPSTPAS